MEKPQIKAKCPSLVCQSTSLELRSRHDARIKAVSFVMLICSVCGTIAAGGPILKPRAKRHERV